MALAVLVFIRVTLFCILSFPESKQAARIQEVGNIGTVAGKVKHREEPPVPISLYRIHAEPLDLLLEPPVVVV